MSKTTQKVLILGLDGATWRLLRPLIEAGKLPNLAALVKNGASGVLRSAVPPLTATAWTDFQTGANAGKHGVFDFRIFERRQRRLWLVSSNDIHLPTLWQIASQAGKRVIAVNVPMTFPPQAVNGLVIGGMLAQNEDASLVYPPERYEQIFSRHPDYRISPPVISQRKQMGRKAFIDANIEVERRRAELALDLLQNEEWDVFMLQNQCLDYIQHAYYQLMDPQAAEFDPEGHVDVLRFYQAMDENVGRLAAAVPPETDIVVLSDHGFKLQHHLVHLAPWLRQEGYLVEKISARQRLLQLARRLDVFRLRRRLAHRILPNKQARFGAAASHSLERIDWQRSRAFVAIGSVFGCIYINHEQVSDAEALMDEMEAKLLALRHPASGQPLVERVLRGARLYHGPYAENGPDLIAVPAEDVTFGAPSLVVHRQPLASIDFDLEIPGGHHPEGILIWSGSGVQPQQATQADLRDVAPTVLARLGLSVPRHMDGRPQLDLFTDPPSVEYSDWQDGQPGPGAASGERDEAALEERLRDLGYL